MLLIKSLFLVTHFLSLATATPPPTRFRGYDPKDPCPRQCGLVGTDPQDWAVYYSLEALDRCTRPLLLDFKLDAELDHNSTWNKIRACSIWGDNIPAPEASVPDLNSSTQNITLQRTGPPETVLLPLLPCSTSNDISRRTLSRIVT